MEQSSETAPEVLSRAAGRRLEQALGTFPVVAVTGARQTGKTTLVRSLPLLHDHLYLTLDDLDVREQARDRPDALVQRAPKLVLDEVQREPSLALAVKRAVDRERPRRPGRFVLTGSAHLLLTKHISDTLAGRACYIPLWPFTRRERLGLGSTGIWSQFLDTPTKDWRDLVLAAPPLPGDWRELARRGGYPTPAYELESFDQARLWFEAYVTTYLERDLQDLASVDNLVDFRRLMRAACGRLGNLLNQAELGRDVGLPKATTHRYLNLLEASYQLVRIEPYAVNRTKRLVKSPKVFWSDTGVALSLSGGEPTGRHLENIVLSDLLAWRDSGAPASQILFWRTVSGHEVDFVIEQGDILLPIEVKASSRPRPSDLRGIAAFRDEYGRAARGGILLHDGEEVSWMERDILAVPWWRVI